MKTQYFLLILLAISFITSQDASKSGLDLSDLAVSEDIELTNKEDTSQLPPDNPTAPISDLQNSGSKIADDLSDVLANLPPAQQQVISGCMKSNTDTSNTLTDNDCFLQDFSSQIKDKMVQTVSDALTNKSKTTRGALSCLTKTTQTFGGGDDTATGVVNTQVSTAVAIQTNFNSCVANFSTFLVGFSLNRFRGLIAKKDLQDQAAVKDSTGKIKGFVFTQDEQTSMIKNFLNYANCLYDFNNNFNQKVLDIQATMTQLPQCASTDSQQSTSTATQADTQSSSSTTASAGSSTSTSTTPIALTPLSTTSTDSSTTTSINLSGSTGTSTGSSTTTSINLSGSTGTSTGTPTTSTTTSINLSGSTATSTSSSTGTTAVSAGTTTTSINLSGTKRNLQQSDSTTKDDKPSYISNVSGFSVNRDGVDDFGKAAISAIGDSVKSQLQMLISTMKAKNLNQWTTLANKIATDIDPSSGYRSKPDLHRVILDSLQNSADLKTEFNHAVKGESCKDDYVVYCTNNVCDCIEGGCPPNFLGEKKYPLQQKQAPTVSGGDTYDGKKVDVKGTVDLPPNATKDQIQKAMTQISKNTNTKTTTQTSGGKPTDQTNGGKPTDQTGGKPTDQTGGKPTDKTGGKPTDKTGGKPTDQTGGKPTAPTGGSQKPSVDLSKLIPNMTNGNSTHINGTNAQIPKDIQNQMQQLGNQLQGMLNGTIKNGTMANTNNLLGTKPATGAPTTGSTSGTNTLSNLNNLIGTKPTTGTSTTGSGDLGTTLNSMMGSLSTLAQQAQSGQLPTGTSTTGSSSTLPPPPTGTSGTLPPPPPKRFLQTASASVSTLVSTSTSGSTSTASISTTTSTSTKPAETEPTESKPTSTKPAETQPAETKPAETEPTETETSDSSITDSTTKTTASSSTSDSNDVKVPVLNFGNQSDSITNYYTASVCLQKKRFIFTDISFSLSGNVFDLVSGPHTSIGHDQVKQQNNCGWALKSGTDSDKQKCRGNMNDQCSKSLDQTCKSTGLYNVMANNPSLSSAIPPQCDSTAIGYSDNACFSWIVRHVLRATIVPDIKALINISKNIQTENEGTTTATGQLRYLGTATTTDAKVVTTDPTQSDPAVIKLQAQTKIQASDVVIDNATQNTTPNAALYISDLNDKTTQVKSGSNSYFTISYLVIGILVTLF
jgi:hypothetical protein